MEPHLHASDPTSGLQPDRVKAITHSNSDAKFSLQDAKLGAMDSMKPEPMLGDEISELNDANKAHTGFVMEGDKLDSPSTTNKVATTNTEDCVGENGGHCTWTSDCCGGLACEGYWPNRTCLRKLDDRGACDEDNDCKSGECWIGYCWCAATNTKKGGGLLPKQLRGQKEENDVEMSDGNSNTPLEAGFWSCVKENGGHCTFTSSCCDGLRCDGFIPNRTCLPKLGPRGSCDEDNDCKSGECWNGYCWC